MKDPIIYSLQSAMRQITDNNEALLNTSVEVKTLSPNEAIGSPGIWDYPLLRGKEILLQATFRDSRGQAFTGSPTPFNGKLRNILELDLDSIENRAIFIATFNALLRDQKLIDKTVHCRNSDPEECGRDISDYLKRKYKPKSIGVAGYQPALISALIDVFGPENVNVTDLSAENLNRSFKGTTIMDGLTGTEKLIAENNILLVTGSVFVNNTAEPFYNAVLNSKPVYFFGTSVTGIAHALDLPHICPFGS